MSPATLWRVFPWDPRAAEGDRFSAAFVPMPQGSGRFDLPGNVRGVVYFAESPEHAVAEMIQQFRNHPDPLTDADLMRWGYRLALVSATLEDTLWPRIRDLCDPATLSAIGVTAEVPDFRDRRRTQGIAVDLHGQGIPGLRWWSAFWGEWHSVILFQDHLGPDAVSYGTPAPLDVTHPAVREAAALLDIG